MARAKSLVDLSALSPVEGKEHVEEKEPVGLQIVVELAHEQLIGQNSIASMSMKGAVRNLELNILYKKPEGSWKKYAVLRGSNGPNLTHKISETVKALVHESGYLA